MKGDTIKELAEIINKHSFDSALNMPDFVIAEMLYEFLCVMQEAVEKEKKWRKGQ